MTRKEYEAVVKAIMETTAELLKKAKSDEEKMNLVMIQNLQIKSFTDEYMNNK